MGNGQSYSELAAYDAERFRTKRQALVAAGICVRCALSPAQKGYRQCYSCRLKHREYERRCQRIRRTAEKVKAPPAGRGSQWFWTFSVDMPTIFTEAQR
jgi:hypothetical protein